MLKIRQFVASPDTWLLMTALPGRTAYQCMKVDPGARPAIVAAIADHLRALHALPIKECPFNSQLPLRLAHARRRIEASDVDATDFGDDHDGWTPEEVWREMMALLPVDADPVVTHGDYSLDNILIEDGRVTGLIDVARAGIADRYQDLAILWNCLGEFDGALRGQLATAYGLAKLDARKIKLHLCLDEFF